MHATVTCTCKMYEYYSTCSQSPCQSQVPSEDEEFSRDPWIGMFNEYKQSNENCKPF